MVKWWMGDEKEKNLRDLKIIWNKYVVNVGKY
jgi:hypothetical protein